MTYDRRHQHECGSYNKFQEHILDTERAQRHRQNVLESGGSLDGTQDLAKFRS